ncbi:flagellar basal body rod protein FlgC [Thalassorhabdus alkalitolerans]|uniref:Flagellar basal-body rod protein FlgC n=1 Tax=Thalassorhabdus alkalitolerans TaxID=2282697 RepID=A0ABW0YL07_9BACI|nr:flagellar basal body rod protein FlgC [Thalassobacillus sp. C254]
MSLFQGINSSASALTSQRLRMDVASANMANAETTRGAFVDGEWEPYRRKNVAFAPNSSNFASQFQQALKSNQQAGGGVKVTEIVEDESPFRQVYQPEHPDADEEGYVAMPNVDPLKEMVNIMGATRSYEANVTVMNSSKNMMLKALEIGRG